jgi:hypothetical protein
MRRRSFLILKQFVLTHPVSTVFGLTHNLLAKNRKSNLNQDLGKIFYNNVLSQLNQVLRQRKQDSSKWDDCLNIGFWPNFVDKFAIQITTEAV